MSLYVVLDEKLSHGKFGVLTKGDKFNAYEKEVTDLLKSKRIKLFDGVTHKVTKEDVVSDEKDIDTVVVECDEQGEAVEAVKSKKKGKK